MPVRRARPTRAVRVTGAVPAEVATALTDRYGRAVVVVPGEPAGVSS